MKKKILCVKNKQSGLVFILISIPPPSAGGTNSNESVLTLYVVL